METETGLPCIQTYTTSAWKNRVYKTRTGVVGGIKGERGDYIRGRHVIGMEIQREVMVGVENGMNGRLGRRWEGSFNGNISGGPSAANRSRSH